MAGDFRQLRYFVATAELLHMARAAEQLGIAQPALSQQIKVLETQLGVPLFLRRKRRIELTDAGLALLPEAKRALAQADHAMATAQRAGRGEIGIVEISYVPSAMLEPALPRALREYVHRYPEVALRLTEIPVDDQIAGLNNDTLDIAFLRGPIAQLPDGFTSVVISRQRMMAVVPKGGRFARAKSISLADLAQEPHVMLEDPPDAGFASAVMAACRSAGFTPRIAVTAKGLSTVICLVAAGLGVSVVPAAMQSIKPDGALFKPLDDEIYTELIVLHRRFERSAAVQQLMALVLAI